MSERAGASGPKPAVSASRATDSADPGALGLATQAPGRAPKRSAPKTAQDLVDELVIIYKDQVRRALDVELDDSATSLAFVDHHLRSAQGEDRSAILLLLASSAGAYYGELIRRRIGGSWIGDGSDPRRLRLLMKHQFIYFSPVDQALEAIAGKSLELDDPRLLGYERFDPAFRLQPLDDDTDDDPSALDEDHDAVWLSARLSEVSQVPEDQYVSLTCRFETLELMHELLATKHVADGRSPRELGLEDYLEALARDASGNSPAGRN